MKLTYFMICIAVWYTILSDYGLKLQQIWLVISWFSFEFDTGWYWGWKGVCQQLPMQCSSYCIFTSISNFHCKYGWGDWKQISATKKQVFYWQKVIHQWWWAQWIEVPIIFNITQWFLVLSSFNKIQLEIETNSLWISCQIWTPPGCVDEQRAVFMQTPKSPLLDACTLGIAKQKHLLQHKVLKEMMII